MLRLLEAQLEVLLTRDAQGRLVATRDPSPQPARGDLDRETSAVLQRLCATEPSLRRTRGGPPGCRQRVLGLLEPVEAEYRGPCYVLPDELPADSRALEVGPDESREWAEAFPWLPGEFAHVAPVAIAFEAGQPAAICHSPRGMTDRAAEAGVEALEGFRGRGLATAAVACWARAVQRAGRLALYSTSWENAASRALARRLSAHAYGENWYVM